MTDTPFQPVLPGTPEPIDIPEPVEKTPRRQVSATHRMLSAWVSNEVHEIVTRRAVNAGMSTSAYLDKQLTYYMTRKHGNGKK